MLDQGDAYLTALNGHAGEFTATLTALGAGLEGLKRNAPALLDTVDNVVVTSQTIVAKRERLAAALTGADHTVQDLLPYWRRYDTRFVNDMHDGAGLVATIAQSPMPLAESLSGLGAGAAMLANSPDELKARPPESLCVNTGRMSACPRRFLNGPVPRR